MAFLWKMVHLTVIFLMNFVKEHWCPDLSSYYNCSPFQHFGSNNSLWKIKRKKPLSWTFSKNHGRLQFFWWKIVYFTKLFVMNNLLIFIQLEQPRGFKVFPRYIVICGCVILLSCHIWPYYVCINVLNFRQYGRMFSCHF